MTAYGGRWPDGWSQGDIDRFCEQCDEMNITWCATIDKESVRILAWELVREDSTLEEMDRWLQHCDEIVTGMYDLCYEFEEYICWLDDFGFLRPFVSLLTLPRRFRLSRAIQRLDQSIVTSFRKWLDIRFPNRARKAYLDLDENEAECCWDHDDDSGLAHKAVPKQ